MRRKRKHTHSDTDFLGEVRRSRGLTRAEVADVVGISERHYRRLEQEEIFDPGVRLLHNCAIALGCSLYEILPAEYYQWTTLSEQRPEPPVWEAFFRPQQAEQPDLTIRVAGDLAFHTDRWLEDRIDGLRALAQEHGVALEEPVLRIPPTPSTDQRLDGSLDVLNAAAANKESDAISPSDLLLAIAESDHGDAGALLDQLGVRDEIIRQLSIQPGQSS